MTWLDFIILLVVAGVCGSLARAIAGYSHVGCLASVALGFIGALLGTWLAGTLGAGEILPLRIGGRPFPIIWSIIGASLFLTVLHLFRRREPRS
jgi:uncharacterized membrane protein YeaQ/YmgE (transglycosylase-associated protein family)